MTNNFVLSLHKIAIILGVFLISFNEHESFQLINSFYYDFNIIKSNVLKLKLP